MARPRLKIDPKQVLTLAAMGCSNREIAAVMDCDESTIRERFPAEVAKGRENGKTKLRRLMWQSAERGNAVMQIWLSKNVLGWSDKVESKNEHSGANGSAIDVKTIILPDNGFSAKTDGK